MHGSRWVAWVGAALAVVGLLMQLAAGWGYRHGWWGLSVALHYLFGCGGIVAVVGCLGSLLSLARRRSALGAAGVIIGVVPGLVLYRQYRLVRSVPPINDVTTDVANPPAYVAAARDSFWKGKDLSFPARWADTVRAACPRVVIRVLGLAGSSSRMMRRISS